jgi:hypothetical protein
MLTPMIGTPHVGQKIGDARRLRWPHVPGPLNKKHVGPRQQAGDAIPRLPGVNHGVIRANDYL